MGLLLEGCWNWDSTPWRECTWTCLLLVPTQEQQIENCLVLWLACQDNHSMPACPHQTPALALPALKLLPTMAEIAIAIPGIHQGKRGTILEVELLPLRLQPYLSPRWRPPLPSRSHAWGRNLSQIINTTASLCLGPSHVPKQGRVCHHTRENPKYLRALAPASLALVLCPW